MLINEENIGIGAHKITKKINFQLSIRLPAWDHNNLKTVIYIKLKVLYGAMDLKLKAQFANEQNRPSGLL